MNGDGVLGLDVICSLMSCYGRRWSANVRTLLDPQSVFVHCNLNVHQCHDEMARGQCLEILSFDPPFPEMSAIGP